MKTQDLSRQDVLLHILIYCIPTVSFHEHKTGASKGWFIKTKKMKLLCL